MLERDHAFQKPGVDVFIVPFEARPGFVERQFRQQCDTVEGFLAVGDHVIAERLDGFPGKRLIDALDFLQADQQMVEPLSDRVDVPRGNTHEKVPDW